MFVVSWHDQSGPHQKGHAHERDARAHETNLLKLGLRSVIVWELPGEAA